MKYLYPLLLISASVLTAAEPPPADKDTTYRSVLSIDPKARAQDYQQAFEALRKEKTPPKIAFELYDGTTISNILDMTLMANGNIILFRVNTPQGIKMQTVKVEDIKSLSHQ
jgi:hypothetical protein